MKRPASALFCITLFACCLAPAHTVAQIALKKSGSQVNVTIAGKPITTFHYAGKWPKPFLHPLRTSGGITVTRGFPLETNANESRDHHWHRGLWFAHGDINGIDFWRETSGDAAQDKKLPLPVGRLVMQGPPVISSGKNLGTLRATLALMPAAGKQLGTLREQYVFRRQDAHILIDVQATIVASHGVALKMGDTEEGLLGFRFADAFREDRGATLLNADGLRGTKNIWGKRARWVDYSTRLENQTVGVAILDHPLNPKHPTYWHARGYGLNAANPFGEHDFHNDKNRDGSVTIPPGGSMTFRYRVVIHHGDATASGVATLYESYAKTR
ncbi:MAG: PmoA family protein [Blastocatellia bacterium]